MKTTIWTINILLFLLTLYGCIEKEGYYGEVGNEVISNLTNKEWNRKYHSVWADGTEVDPDVTYIFKDNGSGSYKEIATFKSGKVEEVTSYFHWSFTTPNFKYIYLDFECFWEIEKLTSNKLSIYETWNDPLTNPGQTYRDFQEYQYSSKQ